MAKVMCLVGLLALAFGMASQTFSGEERTLLQGLALALLVGLLASFYLWWKALGAAIRFVLFVLAVGAAFFIWGRIGRW